MNPTSTIRGFADDGSKDDISSAWHTLALAQMDMRHLDRIDQELADPDAPRRDLLEQDRHYFSRSLDFRLNLVLRAIGAGV